MVSSPATNPQISRIRDLFQPTLNFLGYELYDLALTGTAGPDYQMHTQPRRQLDNVRQRAHELERENQKAADDLARKVDGN